MVKLRVATTGDVTFNSLLSNISVSEAIMDCMPRNASFYYRETICLSASFCLAGYLYLTEFEV